MTAYYIQYKVRNNDMIRSAYVDAKDIKSAKNKLGRKHKYKSGRMIQVQSVSVIGYY